MIRDRLKQYKLTKNFSNRDLSAELGIDEQKIGKILNGKYQGSFEDFEYLVQKLSKTPDDEYYYSTGKHLPEQTPPQAPPPTPNCTNEMKMLNNTIQQLSQIITHLSAKMDQLSAEISHMREENKSQGRLAHSGSKVKVPDH